MPLAQRLRTHGQLRSDLQRRVRAAEAQRKYNFHEDREECVRAKAAVEINVLPRGLCGVTYGSVRIFQAILPPRVRAVAIRNTLAVISSGVLPYELVPSVSSLACVRAWLTCLSIAWQLQGSTARYRSNERPLPLTSPFAVALLSLLHMKPIHQQLQLLNPGEGFGALRFTQIQQQSDDVDVLV